MALVVALPVLVGCSSTSGGASGDAADVELTYARKSTDFGGEVVETVFNESHSEMVHLRRGERAGTIMVPGRDTSAEVVLAAKEVELAELPPDVVFPRAYVGKIRYERANQKLIWSGEMTLDEYHELRGLSDERTWEKAIAGLYRQAHETEVVREGLGYEVDRLPAGTFPAEDDIMRATPEAFHELGFFEIGMRAADRDEAVAWFHNHPTVRECLVITVDGNTSVLPIPSLQDFPGTEAGVQEFKRRLDIYKKCQIAFAAIASKYRPASVTVGGGREIFTAEQQALRDRAERERAEMERRAQENATNPPNR